MRSTRRKSVRESLLGGAEPVTRARTSCDTFVLCVSAARRGRVVDLILCCTAPKLTRLSFGCLDLALLVFCVAF